MCLPPRAQRPRRRRTMNIQLRCVEPGHRDDVWQIGFDRTHATIFGPKGDQLIRLSPEEAEKVFELPSQATSNHFGLREGKRVVAFEVSHEGLVQIREFLDNGVKSLGPEAVL